MTVPQQRRTNDFLATEECYDGTICENTSRCVPNPYKEGAYICDCDSINDSDHRYAGIYCEHRATAYCQQGPTSSVHAFCTNNGECKAFVGRNDKHLGCKCPWGYEGDFCQYVEGSVPTEWSTMDPALASAYQPGEEGNVLSSGAIIGIVCGSVVAFVALCSFLVMMLSRREGGVVRGSTKPVVDGSLPADVGPGGTANGEFVGDSSRPSYVTEDSLDADGTVLAEAMQAQLSPSNGGLQEVDLDDLPSSLEDDDKSPKEII